MVAVFCPLPSSICSFDLLPRDPLHRRIPLSISPFPPSPTPSREQVIRVLNGVALLVSFANLSYPPLLYFSPFVFLQFLRFSVSTSPRVPSRLQPRFLRSPTSITVACVERLIGDVGGKRGVVGVGKRGRFGRFM